MSQLETLGLEELYIDTYLDKMSLTDEMFWKREHRCVELNKQIGHGIEIEAWGNDFNNVCISFENDHVDLSGNKYCCFYNIKCPLSILSDEIDEIKNKLIYFKDKLYDIEEFRLEPNGKDIIYTVDYENKTYERNDEKILLYNIKKTF